MRKDTAVPLDALLAQRSWIRALARSLVRDPSTVDDIEQEVLVAAMTGPKVETSLRGWLRTVVKNAVYQRHRGDSRRTAREQAAPPLRRPTRSPEAIVAEADSHRHVVQTVMDLDEPYRTTVLVRYFEGLSIRETAERLGVPRETVKTRMRRGHAILRERLRDEHGDERRGVPAILLPLVGGPSGLTALLQKAPTTIVGARPWTPLAAAAGLLVAASLIGVAVHASTGGGEGGDGVVFAVAPANDDGGVSEDSHNKDPEAPAAPGPDERERVGAKPPAEEEPAPQADPPAPVPLDHFVVRDLYTENPVPHVALKITSDGGVATESADESGRIAVAPAGVTRIECSDPTWTVPGAPRASALVDGNLWVHRTASVDVTVVDADPRRELTFSSAELIHLVQDIMGRERGPGTPGSFNFNTRTGLDRDQGRTPIGPDGRARMTVPVVRGLRISSVVPGWRSASAPVVFDDGLQAQPLSLELTSGVSFDGRVRDTEGNVVAGAQVLMTTARHITDPEVDVAALRSEGGGGVSLGGSPTKGWNVSWQARVTLNARGIFQGRVTADGDVLLIVTAPGFVPQRVPLGRPTVDTHKIEIELERPDPTLRTLLALDGVPVRGQKILFHDVTDNPQVSTYVQTDDEGTFASQMLIEGRRYNVGVRVPGDEPHELRLITWDGRKTINVEELSQDFEGDNE